MQEQVISLKYDGPSESIKKHQMDVRLLAAQLDGFADLISSSDERLNNREDATRVEVKADFVPGSFGIEFVVFADPAVLKALGLIAVTAVGSVVSILTGLKGEKIKSVEIDETNGQASIQTTKGTTIVSTAEVASLITDPKVRETLHKLIHEPLYHEGISSVSVYDGPLPDEDDVDPPLPILEVDTEKSVYFKRPAKIEERSREEVDTVGKIEFKAANKDSGTTGWRMNYLAFSDVPVKIDDEIFMARIKVADAPAIFGQKFSVKLTVVKTKVRGEVVRTTFAIEKVIGPVPD